METILHYACENNSLEKIRFCLENGAKANVSSKVYMD